MNEFLERLSGFDAICRILYGIEEPKHLPKGEYCFNHFRGMWFESDKALKRRIKELINEQNSEAKKDNEV